MNFFAILKLLMELAPAIVQTVHTVEGLIPGAGQGTKKLDMVLSTVTAASKIASGIRGDVSGIKTSVGKIRDGDVSAENIQQITDGITHIVNTSVQVFNDTGAFPRETPGAGD